MSDPEILTDFLAVAGIRASPIGAITESGSEQVVMIEVVGTIGGDETNEGYVRLVVDKDTAMQLRANLDWTIENWSGW